MYVSSRGVTQENPRQNQYFEAWPERQGHSSNTPRRVSRLRSFAGRSNSLLTAVIIASLFLSAGLAATINSRANAARPSAAVRNFGAAAPLGTPDVPTRDEVVAIASAEGENGYWIATKRGEVYPFGNAQDFGELPAGQESNIVDIASTPTGLGYWLMSKTGAVFTFGDAMYFGGVETTSTPNVTFVALVPTAQGDGYTLVDSAGNVIVFGEAKEYGKASMLAENDKIVDASLSQGGEGYVMVSKAGSVFAFGDARFHGAAHPGLLSAPASAISPSADGKGYWLLAEDGGIFTFGDASFLGAAVAPEGQTDLPSIDLAIYGEGEGYWIAKGKEPQKPQTQSTGVPGTSARSANDNSGVRVESGDIWQALRNCEAGGDYTRNSGNGYYGAYQFSARTWRSMGTGYEYAHLAPPEVQDDAAQRLQARSGWGQWPACTRKLGLR
jgi:hypothetical protein